MIYILDHDIFCEGSVFARFPFPHKVESASCSLPERMPPKRCSRSRRLRRRRRAAPAVLLLALHLYAHAAARRTGAGAGSALALGGFHADRVRVGGRRGGGGAPLPASLSLALSPPATAFAVSSSGVDAELLALSQRHSAKVPGSESYRRAYNQFSEAALSSVRSGLEACLPVAVDRGATEDLSFRLGMAADVGAMPSFAHPGARAGYALGYFCRARLLADVLFAAQATERARSRLGERAPDLDAGVDADVPVPSQGSVPNFLGECVHDLLVAGHRDVARVGSLGGGPGFDFVAAAVLASHASLERRARSVGTGDGGYARLSTLPPTAIEATVFEYEGGWSDIVPSMEAAVQESMGSGHALGFGRCDITLPLTHGTNAACRAAAGRTDLWICSYCVAENAGLLRSGSFGFFRQLFNEAPQGTLFVFTETTHRLWPEIVDAAMRPEGNADADVAQSELLGRSGFDVSFPRITRGRGKSGFQLAMRKRAGARLGAEELTLCARFRMDNERHECKISGGWQRQQRKVRGKKANVTK